MTAKNPSIHDHPWLLEQEGLDPSKLGAVMLPVRFTEGLLDRGYELGIISPDDLYTAKDPSRFWVAGDMTEIAHITLMYGLLKPAFEQAGTVGKLLSGWARPSWLPIASFGAFPSPFPDEPYSCIVAHVGDTLEGALATAHGLLSYIPHVDTNIGFKPHATVAYVKRETEGAWLEYLSTRASAVMGVEVPAPGLGRPAFDLGENRG